MSRRPVTCVWARRRWSVGAEVHDHRLCRDLLSLNVGHRPSPQVIAGRHLLSLAGSAEVETACGDAAMYVPGDGWFCPVHGSELIDAAPLLDAMNAAVHAVASETGDSTDPWLRAQWVCGLAVALLDGGLDPFAPGGVEAVEWLQDDALGMLVDGYAPEEAVEVALRTFVPTPAEGH